MSRLSRRLTLSALCLVCVLTLAASPAQARESPASGWFGALAHEVAQWAGGWWNWPAGKAGAAATGKSTHSRTAAAVRLPGSRPNCGGQIDPDGCPAATRLTPPARPPGRLRVECGGQVDPNGKCM
jgi:hypothetical protein